MFGIELWRTYTGGIEVAGPGAALRDGKGVSAQACSISFRSRPGGMCALTFGAGGKGITSEQSTMSFMSWPRTESLTIAAEKAV